MPAEMLDVAHGFVDNDAHVREPDDETKHIAILRRGNVWYHKAVCFNKGVRVVISDAMFLWMEEHAVDFVASEDKEVTGKAKFEYRMDYDGPEPIGTALDTFQDFDDDKLRRREAYREPYRAPVARAVPRTRTQRIEEAHQIEAGQSVIPVRARTRTRG